MKLDDLTGRKFGKLQVLHRAPNHITSGGQVKAMWVCRCECGKEIEAYAAYLKRGTKTSCGCERKQSNFKHGDCLATKKSRLYEIWNNMKSRCMRPTSTAYQNYGGRGIAVCKEWLDYPTFKKWALTNGYSDNLTIDRINNDGNYEPSNCRWATLKIQGNNTRHNVVIEYNGERHSISEWADLLHIPYKTLHYRLRSGWDVSKAFSTPLRKG